MGSEGPKIGDFEMVSVPKIEKPVMIPPILLVDYDDFKNYANDAVLVTYDVEFFNGPFLDVEKKFRRLTLHAIGVKIESVPLTFKFVLDYNSLELQGTDWVQKTTDLDALVRNILDELNSSVRLVRGTIDQEQEIGAVLSAVY